MSSDGGTPVNQRGLFARFWKSASHFWLGKSAPVGWALSFFLVGIAIAQVAVQYQLNYWNRDFFNALRYGMGLDLAGRRSSSCHWRSSALRCR
jgi:putative ATP-binding cassette transporter